ncbi:hypothetical protein ACFFWD_18035 [Bradyrhizobium erythrophlei]
MSDQLKAELDDANRPALPQWLRGVTRETPLRAPAVAFVLGAIVVRR